MKKPGISFSILVVLAAILLTTRCAVNPVTGKTQIMLMSEAQEIQMGKDYDPQVISTFGEYKDDAMLNFIKTKGAEMGKISHRPNLVYNFRVLDSPVVNAFAVPGGYIYVTRGILAQLNNEAELMGILGHEMGHVTARHTVSQQTKQQIAQLALMGGMIASKKFAQYAEQAMQGMQLLFLRFSRDDEREADRLGVQYMSLIGYDAHRMADFFQVLNKMSMAESQGGVPTFLSTHPDPGDRYNTVNQNATKWQDSLKLPEYKVNETSYLKLIDGIIFGDDPRQGYTENNVFYHPELKLRFTYPAGWLFQNSPIQVAMAPQDQKAMIVFSMAQQKTPDEASQVAIKELGLTLVESKNITVEGMPALAVTCNQVTQDQSTGQQSANQVLSYYINYDGKVYVFHGVAGAADFAAYKPGFESTMASFAKLTDPAKINVKPKKIIVKTVQKAGTLSEVFASYNVPQKMMSELALLNDLELTSKIPVGKMIKVVGE